jgi:arylsulfatase A-like enzyme
VRKNGHFLDESVPTLAEVLGREGYVCGAFLANAGQAGWPGFEPLVDARDRDAFVTSQAKGWLRAVAHRRFFLWIHYFAPHRPYWPPAPCAERFDPGYTGPIDGSIEQMKDITARQVELSAADLGHMLALYDGEVLHLDRLVGELLGTLTELGLEERTLVMLTSDHGEDLYERNYYFSHSASIYDSSLRIPWIVRWPGRVPAGVQLAGVTEAIDIAPTLLDLAGLRVPRDFAGVSLARRLRTSAPPAGERYAFSELEDRVVSIRSQRYRYVYNPDDFDFPLGLDGPGAVYPIAPAELYAHDGDPGERRNVVAAEPEVATGLAERIRRWQREHDWEERSRAHADKRIPDELRESLEAIGYVQ